MTKKSEYDPEREGYVLRLTSAEPYFISVVVVDNYGRKSERVTITAIPSNKGVPFGR